MSLHSRTTEDYSPLRGPIVNPHTGRDVRSRNERQQYEAAVNARREMLNIFDTMPPQKLSKKDFERYSRMTTPKNDDPEIPQDQREKLAVNAHARTQRVLKGMLHPSIKENSNG